MIFKKFAGFLGFCCAATALILGFALATFNADAFVRAKGLAPILFVPLVVLSFVYERSLIFSVPFVRKNKKLSRRMFYSVIVSTVCLFLLGITLNGTNNPYLGNAIFVAMLMVPMDRCLWSRLLVMHFWVHSVTFCEIDSARIQEARYLNEGGERTRPNFNYKISLNGL